MVTLFEQIEEQRTLRPLREYQQRSLTNLRLSISKRGNGWRCPVLYLPTGAGKTQIAVQIISDALSRGNRVLFVVPLLSLMGKTIKVFESQGITDIGVIQRRHSRTDPGARVQVASKQTLIRRPELMKDFDVVLDDECHRMYAEFSAWMKRDTKTVFIGLSASPGTKGMGLVYDGVVVGASISELLEKGAICPFEVYDRGTAPSRKKLKVVNGEYSDTQTEAIMSDKVLVADVYKMWQQRGSRAKWLVFCQTCAHAKLVMESFVIEGVRCGYIDADTPQDERNMIFDAYRAGDIDVMFSVGCLGTGVDELVYGISLAYITRSRDKLTQDLGRGGRPAEGKKVCWVNDHGGNIENLGAPEDYDYSELCCKDPKDKGDSRIDEQKVATQKKCGKCFILLPPKTSVCPKCGEKPAVCKIETVEGTLVKREEKPPKPKKDDKQAFYSGLLSIAQERGYKPGWVANQYRANFGVWPKGLVDFPVRPTPTVRKFIHDKQLEYFNSKTKEASHV